MQNMPVGSVWTYHANPRTPWVYVDTSRKVPAGEGTWRNGNELTVMGEIRAEDGESVTVEIDPADVFGIPGEFVLGQLQMPMRTRHIRHADFVAHWRFAYMRESGSA